MMTSDKLTSEYSTISEELAHMDENLIRTSIASDKFKREIWTSKAEFLLSCIGLTVGLGNIWRFPYLAYENGGAAFLLPYVLALMSCGILILLLETGIGQFTSHGPIQAFGFTPFTRGLGLAITTVCLYLCSYYNVLIAYVIFYIYYSFYDPLPWTDCMPWWGATERCLPANNTKPSCYDEHIEIFSKQVNKGIMPRVLYMDNSSIGTFNATFENCTFADQSPSQQFWEIHVLGLSKGPQEIGSIKLDLAVSLFASWVLIYFCLFKGIKWTGKVSYVSATLPYIYLVVMSVVGVLQPGAIEGLRLFLVPTWSDILNPTVWQKALEQVCFSMTASTGALIVYGSYNPFGFEKLFHSAVFICIMDFIASLLGGIVSFSMIGHLAHLLKKDVETVVDQKMGLAFVTYPMALSNFKLPQFWALLFFVTLLLLGIDSQYAMVETLLTAVKDRWPTTRRYQERLCLIFCSVMFFGSLIYVTRGGRYVLEMVDTYGVGIPMLTLAFFEVVSIMWVYGARSFYRDMTFMLKRPFGRVYIYGSQIALPLVLGILVVVAYATIRQEDYGPWVFYIGIFLMLSSILQPVMWALAILVLYRGNLRAVFKTPLGWGPADHQLYTEWGNFKTKPTLE